MIFVELCAGSAAVTWRLLGGEYAVPPVGYMGGKRRYATAILGALGLRPGQGADGVVLVDASSWGWVWKGLLDLEVRGAACSRLRSWSDKDPVQLWHELKDSGEATDPAERIAQWLWLQGRSANCTPVWWEGGKFPKRVGAKGNFRRLPSWRMGEKGGRAQRSICQSGTAHGRSNGLRSPVTVAERVETIAELLASWLVLQAGGYKGKPITWADGQWKHHGFGRPSVSSMAKNGSCYSVDRVAGYLDDLPSRGQIAAVHGDVRDVEPIPGAMVVFDPPYVGATGYECALPRADVLEVAQRWANAGATVAICEAEPLELEGWHHVDMRPVCPTRKKPEWLTMSRAPVQVPGRQLSLL